MYAQIKEVAYVGISANHPKGKLCNLPILLVQLYNEGTGNVGQNMLLIFK
jgi:hypothetical protein